MSHSILVIDSDPKFLKKVNSAARQFDLTVSNELTGKGGLERAQQSRPSLVLLCLEIEDMNGYMVCKKMRENEETKGIPVIIVSANASDEEFLKNMKFSWRANEYVKKPVSQEKLATLIEELLGLKPQAVQDNEYQDLSEIFAFDDGELDVKPLVEASTQELPAVASSSPGKTRQVSEPAAASATEIQEKDREIEYLRKELAAFKPIMKQLEELEKKNGQLAKSLEEKQQELKKLLGQQSLNQGMEQEKQELIRQLTETQKALDQREKRIQEAEKTIANLSEESTSRIRLLATLEQNLADLKNAQKESEHKGTIGQLDLKKAQSDLALVREELNQLKARHAESEKASGNRLSAAHEDLRELENALAEARKNNRDLESRLKDQRENQDVLDKDFEALRSQVRQNEKQMERLTEQLARKDAEHHAVLSSAEVQFARRYSEKEAELSQQIEQLERDRILLKDKLEEAQAAQAQIAGQLQAHTRASEEEAVRMQEALDRLSAEFNQRLEEMEQQALRADERCQALQEQVQAEQKAAQDRAKAEQEKWTKELQQERNSHQQTRQEGKDALAELKATHDKEWESYLKSVTSQKLELKAQIDKLEESLTQSRSELSAARADWEKRESQMQAASKQMEAAHHKEMALQIKALESLTAQKETFQEKLAESLKKLQTAQQEMAATLEAQEQQRQAWQENAQTTEQEHREKLAQLEGRLSSREKELAEKVAECEALRVVEEQKEDLDRQLVRLKLGHDTLKMRFDRALQALQTGLREIQGTSEELSFEE
jgi:CheY-like chemotaxis protein